jgi:hypothetical protein
MNTRVAGTYMVFTNPKMTIHVHKTIDQPLMNSITTRGYINIDAKDPKGWH